MVLSYNEIRKRALEFSREWMDETRESSESQTFWNEFFEVFGIKRRKVATFEKPCITVDGGSGYIDLFWRSVLVVEHKSKGKDLNKAYNQALEYFASLKDDDLPRYVIVSDFARMKIYDLEKRTEKEFKIMDLADNIGLFDFMSGHEQVVYEDEQPINQETAILMARIHGALKENGYNNQHFLLTATGNTAWSETK